MNNSNLEVIIMVGLPASGKSTIAKVNYTSYYLISLDEIENHSREIEEALIEENLAKGNSIVIADTNLTHEIRVGHIKIARKYNAYIVAVYLDIPIEQILKRNRNREEPVPDATIFRMKKELELPTYAEG